MWIKFELVLALHLLHKQDRPPEFDFESKALAEFSQLEEQLSGVELYIMRYIEAENAEFTAEQLRIAEVRVTSGCSIGLLLHLNCTLFYFFSTGEYRGS